KLPAIFNIVSRFDLDVEGGRAQARANADALKRQADVLDDLRWAQVRPLFVDGDIHLAEFKLGNGAQRLLERITGKTERRACNVHSSLPARVRGRRGAVLPPLGARRL